MRTASAATNLDLATVWPDGNFHTTNAKKFAEEVGKATGGEIKITVQAGGSLGFKGPEQLRAVRDGLVPLADILNIQQIGDEPMLGTESTRSSHSTLTTCSKRSFNAVKSPCSL